MIATEIHPLLNAFIPFPRKSPPPIRSPVCRRAGPFQPGILSKRLTSSRSFLAPVRIFLFSLPPLSRAPPLPAFGSLSATLLCLKKKRFSLSPVKQNVCCDDNSYEIHKILLKLNQNRNPCPKTSYKNKKGVATRGLHRGSPILVLLSPKHA